MTIYTALKESHDYQRGVCNQIKQADSLEKKADLFQLLAHELSCHEAAEEKYLFIPLTDINQDFMPTHYAIKEHHKFDAMVENILMLPVQHPDWIELVKELLADLEKHMKREEDEFFPAIEACLSKEDQLELGQSYRTYMNEYANREELNP